LRHDEICLLAARSSGRHRKSSEKGQSMTDKSTDEDINDSNPPESQIEEAAEIIDDDPMITEMKEAEAEIEAEEAKGKAEAEPQNTDGKTAETEPSAKPKDGKTETLTVPKPRFDEVLSERDLLRDQVGYLQGLNDAKDQQAAKPAQETSKEGDDQKSGTGNQEDSVVDEIDAAIDAASAKKLELAEKYDDGSISTVDKTKAELLIDKEIRELSKQRLEQASERLSKESKAHTDQALTAQQTEDRINDEALVIQQNHPNVEVIDATPPHIRDGIWGQISEQAAQNLAQRGVNVNDGSPQTKLELIKEKAALTDTYTPEKLAAFLPEGYTQPSTQKEENGQTNENQGQRSETAINRQKKLDLADNQPPKTADMGNGIDRGELTEQDIEQMTEDQVADLMQKSPQLVQRILDKPET